MKGLSRAKLAKDAKCRGCEEYYHRGGAEGAEKKGLIKTFSELCELGVSAVNIVISRKGAKCRGC